MTPDNEEPAIGRAPTPRMQEDELDALLALERLVAEERRRVALQANALPPRPRHRGRR
jgi:hypothetical protein